MVSPTIPQECPDCAATRAQDAARAAATLWLAGIERRARELADAAEELLRITQRWVTNGERLVEDPIGVEQTVMDAYWHAQEAAYLAATWRAARERLDAGKAAATWPDYGELEAERTALEYTDIAQLDACSPLKSPRVLVH